MDRGDWTIKSPLVNSAYLNTIIVDARTAASVRHGRRRVRTSPNRSPLTCSTITIDTLHAYSFLEVRRRINQRLSLSLVVIATVHGLIKVGQGCLLRARDIVRKLAQLV